jgi:diguanylate cyclase (GGDEF)-like protein/PAS domain S-box-containing protein
LSGGTAIVTGTKYRSKWSPPLSKKDGREYFLSVARDISRRVALDEDLRRHQPALWFALNEATDGLWDWDLANNTLFFSPQLKRMLGYGPDEMAPVIDTWVNNLHPDDAPRVRRILQEHLAGRRVRYLAEYRLRNRNGHYIWVRDQGCVSERDAQGAPTRVVGMVQNVTEQKLLQFKLESWATNDALTGLPNRRHGEEYLQSQLALARRNGTPLGVCFVDLDYFKTINDEHGHLKGDEVLRAAAQALASGVRRSDMVLRWGGEEFVIVCPGAGVSETLQVASKARAALAALPWQQSLSVPPVTASFGVAVFPEHGDGSDDLVQAADSALYRAKAGQRDRIELAQPAGEF